jgi:signal transduction histidine kinase
MNAGSAKSERSCGSKHLTLVLWILGLVAAAMTAIGTATSSRADRQLEGLEVRVRMVEQSSAANDAANAERFRVIQQALERIERQQQARQP